MSTVIIKRKQKKRSAAIIEALEPRVLFSADVFSGVIENPVLDDPLATLLDDAVAAFENQATHTQNEQTDSSDPQPLSEDEGEDANALLTAESIRKELFLVDSVTPEYQQLLDDLLAQGV